MVAVAPLKNRLPPLTVCKVATPPAVKEVEDPAMVSTEAAPRERTVPPVIVVETRLPVVTEPPLMFAVSNPLTRTVPADRPLERIALLLNPVLPVAEREARVIVPLVALKRRLSASAFVLDIAPTRSRSVPETVARPAPLRLRGAAAL